MSFLSPDRAKTVDEQPAAQQFCTYAEACIVECLGDLDSEQLAAVHKARQLQFHLNTALQAALHIDEYQTVWSSVPGTGGEDPFDAIREAIAIAEKSAIKGY